MNKYIVLFIFAFLAFSCSANNSDNLGSNFAPKSFGVTGSGWSYRRFVTVSNSGVELNNYQVKLILTPSNFPFSKTNIDGSDLRITLRDGDVALPYWIEKWSISGATVWVKVPKLKSTTTTGLDLYYGNATTKTLSDGNNAFEFFDDFESYGKKLGYWQLSNPTTVLTQILPWESSSPHTMSVVDMGVSVNPRYWGYYGLQNCSGNLGLAKSNDLLNWQKNPNPIVTGSTIRWPSVIKDGNMFYMIHTTDYCSGTGSYLTLRTSLDGLNWTNTGSETVIVPKKPYDVNQNPNLFKDPISNRFYLYYFHSDGERCYIYVRSSNTVIGLSTAPDRSLMSLPTTLAAPNVNYLDNTYFLTVETLEGGVWKTRAYTSDKPDIDFRDMPGSLLLNNGEACFFQHIFNGKIHAYYCKETAGVWTFEYRSATISSGRVKQPTYDVNKWSATGGNWLLSSGVQQTDGTLGSVLEANTFENHQMLVSPRLGTSYVLEIDGRQISGRVWGAGTYVRDAAGMYSTNLYEDLDTSNNLWTYGWNNYQTTNFTSSVAVGTVNLNSWQHLTLKVNGSSMDTILNGVLKQQLTGLQLPPNAPLPTDNQPLGTDRISLYGEAGTKAQFDNVYVRKFAASEPSISIGTTEVTVASSTPPTRI